MSKSSEGDVSIISVAYGISVPSNPYVNCAHTRNVLAQPLPRIERKMRKASIKFTVFALP